MYAQQRSLVQTVRNVTVSYTTHLHYIRQLCPPIKSTALLHIHSLLMTTLIRQSSEVLEISLG